MAHEEDTPKQQSGQEKPVVRRDKVVVTKVTSQELSIIKNRFNAPWISEIVTILLAIFGFIPFNKYVLKKYPIDEEAIYKQIDRESNLE